MKAGSLAGLVASLLALPSRAQEFLPAPPPVGPPVPPAAGTIAPPGAPGPACGIVECRKTDYRLQWVAREVPVTVTTMVPRVVRTPGTRTDLEVTFDTHQDVRQDYVLKPRETIKIVTCCTQKPSVTKDPVTGCSTITFEPVTE